MKRSVQEIIELVAFALIALLLATGIIWLVGWLFRGVGIAFTWIAGFLWAILIFVIPIAIIVAAVYFLVKLAQRESARRDERSSARRDEPITIPANTTGTTSGPVKTYAVPAPQQPVDSKPVETKPVESQPTRTAETYDAPAATQPPAQPPVVADDEVASRDARAAEGSSGPSPASPLSSAPQPTVRTGEESPAANEPRRDGVTEVVEDTTGRPAVTESGSASAASGGQDGTKPAVDTSKSGAEKSGAEKSDGAKSDGARDYRAANDPAAGGDAAKAADGSKDTKTSTGSNAQRSDAKNDQKNDGKNDGRNPGKNNGKNDRKGDAKSGSDDASTGAGQNRPRNELTPDERKRLMGDEDRT